jgi:hypothetical protein
MLLSYAHHLCSILQHMCGSHESMRRIMVEERLAYLLENPYKLFLLLFLTCLFMSECAVNSAALSFYAVILCTALMQHIATHAR